MAQLDLAVGVGGIGACGVLTAVAPGNLKLDAGQGLVGHAVYLGNEETALGRIAELQGNGLSRLDGSGLGSIVQLIAGLGSGFLDHQGSAGVDTLNQNRTGAVSDKLAVGVAHHGSVGGGDHELHIAERLMGFAVDLLNQQASLGGVAEVQLHHILLLAGNKHGLGCGVNDMAIGTGQLLHDVGARLQAGDCKAAVGAGLIGADHGAAAAGGAAQVAHLEHSAFQGLAGDGIELPDHQGAEGRVFKNQLHSLVVVHINGLFRGVTEGIAGGRINLHHLVPAGVQLIQVDLAVFVGVVEVLFQLLIGAVLGVVLGYPKLKLCPLQRVAGDRINLLDG